MNKLDAVQAGKQEETTPAQPQEEPAHTEWYHRTIEPSNRTVLDDINTYHPSGKRTTERYSFEIYHDQRKLLSRISYLYEEKTGEKISLSRIIREALDEYLNRILDALQ